MDKLKILQKTAIAVFCLLFLWNAGYTQTLDIKKEDNQLVAKNSFTLYPFAFFYDMMKAGYETRIGNNKSIKIIGGVGIADRNSWLNVDSETEFMLEIQPRFYFHGFKPNETFFTGPYISYKSVTFNKTETVYDYSNIYPTIIMVPHNGATASAFSIGYIVGMQGTFFKRVLIEGNLGGGIILPSGDYRLTDQSIPTGYKRGMYVNISLDLGINFNN